MVTVSDKQFNDLIAEVLDELPQEYTSRLDNILITFENQPSLEQRHKMNLGCNQTLFGLYEGIPLTARGNNYNMVIPDRITIFKLPIEAVSNDTQQLRAQIKHTVWHEIAHYFGLNHDKIHEIEANWQS